VCGNVGEESQSGRTKVLGRDAKFLKTREKKKGNNRKRMRQGRSRSGEPKHEENVFAGINGGREKGGKTTTIGAYSTKGGKSNVMRETTKPN